MASPNYLSMLRAKNIFGGGGRQPLGMPDMDDSSITDMLNHGLAYSNTLKNDDMRRKQQMMEFEASLRQRGQPSQSGVAIPSLKKNVVYGGVEPPSPLQQKFRQDDVAATANKNALARQGALQSGALNNALLTGKQRNDADMARTVAEINGRKDVAGSNRASVERAAEEARKDKDTEAARARLEKGPLVNVADPKDPTKMISVRHNPATNKYERVQIGDDQAGTGYKQGTIPKPTANPGTDPVKLAALREHTQSTLTELDELIDPNGKLKSHTEAAVGPSNMIGKVANYVGAGSLTPETTAGRAGINALKGKLVLDIIGEMKAQSKTGATGFGALNKAELAILEQSASKLDQDMPEDRFAAELQKIRSRLQMILKDPDGGGPLKAPGAGGNTSDSQKRAAELIRKHGG